MSWLKNLSVWVLFLLSTRLEVLVFYFHVIDFLVYKFFASRSVVILEIKKAFFFQFQDAVTGDALTIHVTVAPALNDGPLVSDRDEFNDDDVGSGLGIDGSSGSGWGPGIDDEDARGSGDDLPEDDEDYPQRPKTSTTTLPTPTLPTPTLEFLDYHEYPEILSSSISPEYISVSRE